LRSGRNPPRTTRESQRIEAGDFFETVPAADADGNALAVWHQTAGAFAATQALRWDATPPAPSLSGVTPGPGILIVAFSLPASDDPALAPTTLEYSLDGGSKWVADPGPGIPANLVIGGLTDGVTYALRLRTVNSAGAGHQTAGRSVRSGPDGPPTDLRVVATAGRTVTFAWTAPAGLVPTEYRVEGGVLPGETLASVPLSPAGTVATLSLPAGVFHVRIVAVASGLRLATSNEVRVVAGIARPPAAPVGLRGSAVGAALTISWTNVLTGGGPPTGLMLNVTGAATGTIALPEGEAFSYVGVPAGTYTLTVAATNAAGASPPSNAVTLTFPGGACVPPDMPLALATAVAERVVSLAWEPPAAGAAVTGYALIVSGSYNGTLPVAGRFMSARVPPGSYTVRVAAVNACGIGTATLPQTLVVP
jgi:titin